MSTELSTTESLRGAKAHWTYVKQDLDYMFKDGFDKDIEALAEYMRRKTNEVPNVDELQKVFQRDLVRNPLDRRARPALGMLVNMRMCGEFLPVMATALPIPFAGSTLREDDFMDSILAMHSVASSLRIDPHESLYGMDALEGVRRIAPRFSIS